MVRVFSQASIASVLAIFFAIQPVWLALAVRSPAIAV
jgi:hypothetical protein